MRLNVRQADLEQPKVLSYFTELTDIGLRTRTETDFGIFMAEGELTIRRAINHGYSMLAVMAEKRWLDALDDVIDPDVIVIEDDQDRLAEVTGFVIHRGAMAAFLRPEPLSAATLFQRSRKLVLLEGLVNHTNVGAIFRSAAAMGADGILIGPECADPLYRRAIRTSMGAVFSLPWARVEWEEFLILASDWERLALTPAVDAVSIRDWTSTKPFVLMVGTEGEGLTTRAFNAATVKLRIPMSPGIDSLNAAAAAAVACYEVMK